MRVRTSSVPVWTICDPERRFDRRSRWFCGHSSPRAVTPCLTHGTISGAITEWAGSKTTNPFVDDDIVDPNSIALQLVLVVGPADLQL